MTNSRGDARRGELRRIYGVDSAVWYIRVAVPCSSLEFWLHIAAVWKLFPRADKLSIC